jgi:hypothetical protein
MMLILMASESTLKIAGRNEAANHYFTISKSTHCEATRGLSLP